MRSCGSLGVEEWGRSIWLGRRHSTAGWARRWRRPEDVWICLEPDVKKMRSMFGWAGMAFGVCFYLMLVTMQFEERSTALAGGFFAAAVILGGGGFVALTVKSRLWGRKHGITPGVLSKAISTPTSRLDLWRSPELSRLLLSEPPQDERRKPAEPQTLQGIVEAIRRTRNEVRGVNRAFAAEALTAARKLISSIEKAEREVERVSHDVNEDEVSKLEARLEALGESANAKHDYDAEMEELVRNQLLLNRRIAKRLATAKERRNRMNEMLKLLWLHVSDLRTSDTQEKHDASEITGKIRAVCEDIERHVAATEETAKALTPSDQT